MDKNRVLSHSITHSLTSLFDAAGTEALAFWNKLVSAKNCSKELYCLSNAIHGIGQSIKSLEV